MKKKGSKTVSFFSVYCCYLKIPHTDGFNTTSHKKNYLRANELKYIKYIILITYMDKTELWYRFILAGKNAEIAMWRSVFLCIWHCILSADLTETHSSSISFLAFLPAGIKLM